MRDCSVMIHDIWNETSVYALNSDVGFLKETIIIYKNERSLYGFGFYF